MNVNVNGWVCPKCNVGINPKVETCPKCVPVASWPIGPMIGPMPTIIPTTITPCNPYTPQFEAIVQN